MSGNLNRQLSEREFDAKLSLADFVVGDQLRRQTAVGN